MSELIFTYKEKDDEFIIQIKIWAIDKTSTNPDGVSYSLVLIKDKKRIVGYDTFEGHQKMFGIHHKHIKMKIFTYEFRDVWKLIEDFMDDVKKIKEESK